jgi:hypothetical protein
VEGRDCEFPAYAWVLLKKLVERVAAFQILDQNLKWDARASKDRLTPEDVNIPNDWVLRYHNSAPGILTHHSERALVDQAGPDNAEGRRETGEKRAIGSESGRAGYATRYAPSRLCSTASSSLA